jgi:sugar O-acyltransferase (sialic acid O-acetyltransferase NeuD family)
MKQLIVWGSSGHAKVLNEFINYEGFKIAILVDNNTNAKSVIKNVPIIIGISEFKKWLSVNSKSDNFYGAVAIGGEKGRERLNILEIFLTNGIKLPNLIHPKSYIAKDISLGFSNQILANSTVGTNVKIGNGVIINTSASIDHECIINNGVHIGPGAVLAGCIEVGECSFIGTGAVILPKLKIGKNVIVGAGSVVTKDIPDETKVIGNPAKKYVKEL